MPPITCRHVLYLFLILLLIWFCGLIYELYYAIHDGLKEEKYFLKLETQRSEHSYHSTDLDAHSNSRSGPSPVDNLEPLFPEVVQLSTFGYRKSLRLYQDDTCEFPLEHVWIYVAGRRTCPKQDGREICEDYIEAFDRLLEFHHTQRPAANAFLSFVDCDVSGNLCHDWDIDANIMINMQSLSPCDVHMQEDNDSEFRFHCPVIWRFVGLPLAITPYRSLQTFPSAFEQLKALTSINGFIDAIDPMPDLITMNYTDLMKRHGENMLNELQATKHQSIGLD